MFRLFRHYFSAHKTRLFLFETLFVSVAAALGAMGVSWALGGEDVVHFAVALVVAWVCMHQYANYLFDLYQLRTAKEDLRSHEVLLKAMGVTALGISVISLMLTGELRPAGLIFGGSLGAVTASLLVRRNFESLIGKERRVLVLAEAPKAQLLVKAIESEGEGIFDVRGVVSPFSLGRREVSLFAVAQTLGADEVVYVHDEGSAEKQAVEGALLDCRLRGMRVQSGTAFVESALRRIPVEMLEAGWLALGDNLQTQLATGYIKRVVDFGLALVLAVAALPLTVLVALAIRLDSKGPTFYRQKRVGLNGREYAVWKFRSMRVDAEKNGAVWASANDTRVTRVGRFIRKTRIDEIPQVLNVLSGDMSFVGPRPERPEFVSQIKNIVPFYHLREFVKPGITGWAQIRYPYGATIEDSKNKLEFDLYYVKNGSWALDLAIVFHTLRHVLQARGAR